jgi:hypothetical protein
MSKVQKVYRDIEQRLKDNPGKTFIAIGRKELDGHVASLRSYQEEHRSCSVTLEKEEKSSALVTTTTEVQRFKAEIAQLRLENEELKTGSVSRTLGTPLADDAPEAADLETALEQVRYLINHPEYLRLATTRALTRTLTSFLNQAIIHTDDQLTHFPHLSQAIDDGDKLARAARPAIESALDRPGRGQRLLSEAVTEVVRWYDKEESTRAPSPDEPGLEIIRYRQRSPISDPASPAASSHPRSTIPTPHPDNLITHPTPAELETALTTVANYPTPYTPAPPSPGDTELVLAQEPLGPTGKRKPAPGTPEEDDRVRKEPAIAPTAEEAIADARAKGGAPISIITRPGEIGIALEPQAEITEEQYREFGLTLASAAGGEPSGVTIKGVSGAGLSAEDLAAITADFSDSD